MQVCCVKVAEEQSIRGKILIRLLKKPKFVTEVVKAVDTGDEIGGVIKRQNRHVSCQALDARMHCIYESIHKIRPDHSDPAAPISLLKLLRGFCERPA